MASFIRTSDHLTIVFDDGVSATVYASTPKFGEVVKALAAKDFGRARYLALPAEQVKTQMHDTFGIDKDLVTIEHGIVHYEGKEMDNTLTQRMLQMLEEGFDIAPLKLFLINLQQNPSYRAVTELYGFLEKGNLPITEDGHFLAYKKVNYNYTDCRTGTFDNSIGQVVEMPRNEVDEDSRNECSNGLHFCSKEYLRHFDGARTMVVKINPADVVAIPADYASSKGRACRYEVIGELEPEGNLEGSFRDTGTRPKEVDTDWIPEFEIDDELEIDEDEDQWPNDDCLENCGCKFGDDLLPAGFAMNVDDEPLIVRAADGTEVKVPVGGTATLLDRKIEALDPVTGQVIGTYDTVQAAVDGTVGTTVSGINRVLRGERKSTAGYGWKYSDKREFKVTSPVIEDVIDSAFVGIPAEDSVTIPRSVALEIAESLNDDQVWEIEAYEVDEEGEFLYDTYNSVASAAEVLGVDASSIHKVLKGQRKTAGGYTFKRVPIDS